MEKISKLLAQVENLSYDQEFFRTTKLEKVIRRVRKAGITQAYPDTSFNILERCQMLYEIWTAERIKVAETSGVKVDLNNSKKDCESNYEETDGDSVPIFVVPAMEINDMKEHSNVKVRILASDVFDNIVSSKKAQTSERVHESTKASDVQTITYNGQASKSISEIILNEKGLQESMLWKSAKTSNHQKENILDIALVREPTQDIVDSVIKMELESDSEKMDFEHILNEKTIDLGIDMKIGTEMEF
ncbi:hypothetical protein HK096_006297 [Nowakowskiella sp. JEL0078]|nr:hypothetical protein HK096_006297 [Nowakowskiella sp. JEL0078]